MKKYFNKIAGSFLPFSPPSFLSWVPKKEKKNNKNCKKRKKKENIEGKKEERKKHFWLDINNLQKSIKNHFKCENKKAREK